MIKFIKDIINFILPPRCNLCGKVLDEDKGLCDECISQIDFLNGAICYQCGEPLFESIENNHQKLLCGNCLKSKNKPVFRMIRSAYIYDDFSKKLILDFKFYDKPDLASFLAKMLYVAGKDIFEAGVDVIIPIPLHYTRLIKRRYNQSALLAKELGRLTNIKVDYNSLIKRKITKPQVDCDGNERLINVKDAFVVKNIENIQGKKILLVDDVLTTGSTLKECAKALKTARIKSVDAVTVARSIH